MHTPFNQASCRGVTPFGGQTVRWIAISQYLEMNKTLNFFRRKLSKMAEAADPVSQVLGKFFEVKAQNYRCDSKNRQPLQTGFSLPARSIS